MNPNTVLQDLGFNKKLSDYLINYNNERNKKCVAGRVIIVHKDIYKVCTLNGIITAVVSGKFRYTANSFEEYPAVGDWVIVSEIDPSQGHSVIMEIMPRASKFSRKVAGSKSHSQIIAANIDYLFICISLNKDFNLRRLERYLTMVWDSGAVPVVVLTKADLCNDITSKISNAKSIALGVDVYAVSTLTELGIDRIANYFNKGTTVAFIGSSGVGKSTLINYFAGEDLLKTNKIRNSDDKGRHTTTHRELIVLKEGIVIDTPGMREFHILDSCDGVNNTFNDIEELAKQCKFRNCKHRTEPNCAVKEAIKSGNLTQKRLDNYFKLQKEAAYMAKKARLKDKQQNKSAMNK